MMKRLVKDRSGSAAVEMALAGPLFLTLLMGVFVGADYMQTHNALRAASSDVAREVIVAYQRDNDLTTSQIQEIARGVAVGVPYGLDTDKLTVSAALSGSSRVTNAQEINLTYTYSMESFVPIVPLPVITMTYARPIFVAI